MEGGTVPPSAFLRCRRGRGPVKRFDLPALPSGSPCSYLGCRQKEEIVRVRVQQWGDSLALRIPRSYAAETLLRSGSEVDMSLEGGRLVVTPLAVPEYRLEDLLSGITPENLHGEIDTGPRVGAEAW
jgi:antitoxin MazE